MEKYDYHAEWIGKHNLELYADFLTPEVIKGISASDGTVTAIALVIDDMACGAIAGHLNDGGTFDIRSLYVARDYRRQGGASFLIKSVMDRLVLLSDNPLITVTFCALEEDESLIEFFKTVGEKALSDEVYLLTTLESAGGYKEMTNLSFSLLTPKDIVEIRKYIEYQDIPDASQVDMGLSVVARDKGKEIQGYITADANDDDTIEVSSLYATDEKVAKGLLEEFYAVCEDMGFPGKTPIRYSGHKGAATRGFMEFFPDAKDVRYTFDIVV